MKVIFTYIEINWNQNNKRTCGLSYPLNA